MNIFDHAATRCLFQWGDGEDAVEYAIDVPKFPFADKKQGFRSAGYVVIGGKRLYLTISLTDPTSADPAAKLAKQELAEAKELRQAELHTRMTLNALSMAGMLKGQDDPK